MKDLLRGLLGLLILISLYIGMVYILALLLLGGGIKETKTWSRIDTAISKGDGSFQNIHRNYIQEMGWMDYPYDSSINIGDTIEVQACGIRCEQEFPLPTKYYTKYYYIRTIGKR